MKNTICQIRKKIGYLAFILCLFLLLFPQQVSVQVEIANYNIYKQPNSIGMSLAIGEEGNMFDEIEMMSFYHATNQASISLQDFLWKAHKYKFYFDYEPEADCYEINSISLYLGHIRIFNLNADNWMNIQSDLSEKGAYVSDQVLMLPKAEARTYITLGQIRRATLLKVLMIGLLYLTAIVVSVFLIKKNNRLHRWIEEKYESIKRLLCKHPKFTECIVGSIVAFCVAQIINKATMILNLDLYIQRSEIIVGCLALIQIFIYFRHLSDQKAMIFVSSVIMTIAIFVSIAHMTCFFTVDEPRALAEQVNLQDDILRHWNMVNARTNYLIMGTIMTIMPDNLFEVFSISAEQFLKLAHWFCGFILIHYLVNFCNKRLLENRVQKEKIYIGTILYLVFFLLPVLNLAMDNYNYDLFACLFSLIAFAHIWYAYEKQEMKYAWSAIVLGSLALQEKIIAIPIMFVVSVLCICIYVKKGRGNAFKTRCIGAVASIGIQCFVTWVSYIWVVDILKAGRAPARFFENFKQIFRMELLVEEKLLPNNNCLPLEYLIASAIFVIGLVVCSYFVDFLLKTIRQKIFLKVLLECSILLFTFWGIIFTYIDITNITNNSRIVYFHNYLENYIGAFPTVFIIAVIIWLFRDLRLKQITDIEICILLYLTIIMSVLYTIIGQYRSSRYLDLYIIGYMLCFTIIMIRHWNFDYIKRKRNILLSLIVITLIETGFSNPFGYVLFYPLWNVKIYEQAPNRAGWGSLPCEYGRKIVKYCKKNEIPLNEVTIRYGYNGDWNTNSYGIDMDIFMNMNITEDALEDNDFYCVENESLYATTELMGGYEFPIDEVQPVMTIQYRGVIISRIYQGSQLRPYFEKYIY